MELQGKFDSVVRVKAELLERLQRAWFVDNTTHPQQNSVEGDAISTHLRCHLRTNSFYIDKSFDQLNSRQVSMAHGC